MAYLERQAVWRGRLLIDAYLAVNVIYNGYYGITFDADGYKLAPWSILKGQSVPLGLKYMGKEVKSIK